MSKKRYNKQGKLFEERQLSILFDDDTEAVDESPFAEPKRDANSSAPVSAEIDAPASEKREYVNFVSFGSGSSGNCAYLGTEHSGILIDAGVDMDKVFSDLQKNGVKPEMVKGIIITHDHADHIRYAYRIARKYKHIRIYCTPRMLNGMLRHHNLSRRIKDYQENFFKEIPFHIAGMTVTAFETSHDGSDNAGFMIEVAGYKFVVATDMGRITDRSAYYIPQADFLMIESNYDLDMLEQGKYPEYLKSRVKGEKGHLDNVVAAKFVSENCLDNAKYVFLCHLSNENNTPEKALAAMRAAIEGKNLTVGDGSFALTERDKDVQVYALPRYDTSSWFTL